MLDSPHSSNYAATVAEDGNKLGHTMTNDERDKIMMETHSACMTMKEKIEDHEDILRGNGKPGHIQDIILLQERYSECPARSAISTENKRLALATCAVIVSVIAVVASVVFGLAQI